MIKYYIGSYNLIHNVSFKFSNKHIYLYIFIKNIYINKVRYFTVWFMAFFFYKNINTIHLIYYLTFIYTINIIFIFFFINTISIFISLNLDFKFQFLNKTLNILILIINCVFFFFFYTNINFKTILMLNTNITGILFYLILII